MLYEFGLSLTKYLEKCDPELQHNLDVFQIIPR
jgi:hypothetical protein